MSDRRGSVAPAGWYLDPSTSLFLRWWTGREWSEHVSPLPEEVPTPNVDAAIPNAPAAEDVVSAAPMTRREQRGRTSTAQEEEAAAEPPSPQIAPVSTYDWGRESGRDEYLPGRVPVAEEDEGEWQYIPSRWSTFSAWMIMLMPFITAVFALVALVLYAWDGWSWRVYGALAIPYLLTISFAQRDMSRLKKWGYQRRASWAWSLLGAPAYLLARVIATRRSAGIGAAPIWVWLVNVMLVVAAVFFLYLMTGMALLLGALDVGALQTLS